LFLLIHAIISRRFLSLLSSSPIDFFIISLPFISLCFSLRHYLRLRAAAATLMPLIATLLMMLYCRRLPADTFSITISLSIRHAAVMLFFSFFALY